ncbi:hypothetical protein H7J88_19450 [Mycolicibacterium flavescens]|uniref:Uncharacterized protein n=1 Tax=Mycolicibacterium flavescens TaxID=1776 RepID=A0A1E3RM31_MYCFV|nr:hypothetical protein [Mycolicibacterium flavescens]MCV7281809.1 hypothetical protein [Mycolicibacterium flavescens]ODQ90945.1 hypothetical protein BHQ18_08770 [Mycolicibacterium flavescens]
MWTALAAWLAVLVGVFALIYAWRQYRRAKQQSAELMQPNVAMFMEPAANDWHLIELVVKNFGRTPAYDIRFDFANPPTVAKYENVYDDRYVDIVHLNLPAEIPYLAPSQEWRIVWDSALDRKELGESIASRFDGALRYYDKPDVGKKRGRTQYQSTAVLDWSTLHPVERLELLTTHDMARQEKQKLELLRHLLTYYHYAAKESREEVLRKEINQVRAAADELRERYRTEIEAPQRQSYQYAPANGAAPARAGEVDIDAEFEEAHTQILNGRAPRHRAP